ncbi:MAG TPA: helix-turn-helix transcriptional regulator [Candidatus Acidoferrales bacterium]|jgi:DNA-binding CsgD family transcriptional regulator|nr:helix-turn-helix transcriptional regulator [Candidatus Acidoferrales bacterium]
MTIRELDWPSFCEKTIQSVGTAGITSAFFEVVCAVAPICELNAWVWQAPGNPRVIVHTGKAAGSNERIHLYISRYFTFDPAYQAIRKTAHTEWINLRVRPGNISNYQYLNDCYLRPAVVEKLTLACWAENGWFVLNLYRDSRWGCFSNEEREHIAALSHLLLPLLRKHYQLTVESPKSGTWRRAHIEELTQRVASLDSKLTARECSVCARTAAGLTAKTTALELGIKVSSVLTYRRRAYERLSISSGYELAALLIR